MVDLLLHAVGGALIGALLLPAYWWPWWLPVGAGLTGLVYGMLREVAQADDDWSALRKAHKWKEGSAWGVGAALATSWVVLL